MPNSVSRYVSNDLYVVAVLLVLFGSGLGVGGPPQAVPAFLALVCAISAYVVRQGTPVGRLVGLAAAGVTVAYGALNLWSGRGYTTGSIVAVYALVYLIGRPEGFTGGQQPYAAGQFAAPSAWAQPTGYPQQSYPQAYPVQQGYAPAAYPVQQGHPQAYPQPWPQPAAGAPVPQQWSPAQLQQYFAPPASGLPPVPQQPSQN